MTEAWRLSLRPWGSQGSQRETVVDFEPLPCWATAKVERSTKDARREGKRNMMVVVFRTESKREAVTTLGSLCWLWEEPRNRQMRK